MSVPNYANVPTMLYATGFYNLKTHEGHAAFVDAVVATLNGLDSNFRHLKKKPGQTDLHGHGEDSFVYLLPENKAQAGDFVQGAGGPDPKPRWGIDPEPYYTHKDAHDPDDHGIGEAPPPPPAPQFPYPDEVIHVLSFQTRVKSAYQEAGRIFPDPNDSDAYRHFVRYGYSCGRMDAQQAEEKHIVELRKALGL